MASLAGIRSSAVAPRTHRRAATIPSRPSVAARASEEPAQPAPQAGTVFYRGQLYTPAEFDSAIKNGTLPKPAAAAPSSETAALVQPGFSEVLGFKSAPEIINGRLAMLGVVAALAAELNSGESVIRQWAEEPTGIFATFILFIAASLVPFFLGKTDDRLGPFTPQAELLNGRLAMLGFASLLGLEAIRGLPLF